MGPEELTVTSAASFKKLLTLPMEQIKHLRGKHHMSIRN